MWAALAAIAASVVVAWLSLTGGKGGDEAVVVGADYDLGSGQMFDAIAPRYDLINKVCKCTESNIKTLTNGG